MLQFFIPTEIIQDHVFFFFYKWKMKIIIFVYSSICLCDTILVSITFVVWTIRFHCFLVFLSIHFFLISWTWVLPLASEKLIGLLTELIAVFQAFFRSCFSPIWRRRCNVIKGNIKAAKINTNKYKKNKNVFLGENLNSCTRPLTTTCCLNFSEVRVKLNSLNEQLALQRESMKRNAQCTEDKDVCLFELLFLFQTFIRKLRRPF